MNQSRLMSLVESVANVIMGYGVAVITQILIFGLHTTPAQNLHMSEAVPAPRRDAMPRRQAVGQKDTRYIWKTGN